MKRNSKIFVFLAICFSLASCMGIPIRSIPKLYSLQSQLETLNPGEFLLAIQLDARMVPRPGSAPKLNLSIVPKQAGAYEPVNRKIPMSITTLDPHHYRLPAASGNRKWIVYSFPPLSQAELTAIQARFTKLRAEKQTNGGGTLSMGIDQEDLAINSPEFANTRWDSWLQASAKDGFFELWSGSVSQLLEGAKKK